MTVLHQHPRSHYKGATSIRKHPTIFAVFSTPHHWATNFSLQPFQLLSTAAKLLTNSPIQSITELVLYLAYKYTFFGCVNISTNCP